MAAVPAAVMVDSEQRHQAIQRLAYAHAERRAFRDGSPQQDWLTAEREVDARLAAGERPEQIGW